MLLSKDTCLFGGIGVTPSPPLLKIFLAENFLAILGGIPFPEKIPQTVFDPFPKVYDKYHVWVDDAGDYSLGKEFLT